MIPVLFAILTFIIIKLKNINVFNISILIALTGMWIGFGILATTIIDTEHSWKWPIILALPQLTQAAFRLPLGKLSQKMVSRKVPMLIAAIVMVLCSLPLAFGITFTSLIVASIGLGVFGATYGMQNQYWSENWNIRSVFITISILMIVQYIGKYTSTLISGSMDINNSNVKWIVIGGTLFSAIVITTYAIFNNEKRLTIMLDNKGSYAKYVSEYKFKHIAIFGIMALLVSFSITLVKGNIFIGLSSDEIYKPLILTITIFTSLLTSLVLIRFFNDKKVEMFSLVISFIGFMIMAMSLFSIKSTALSMTGFIIALIGTSAYIMNMFGMILHIDHKNSLLVLGIWLTFKSIGIGTSLLITGEVANTNVDLIKYLTIISMSLIVIVGIISTLIYKRFAKKAYDLIEELEHSNYQILKNK